MHQDCLGTKELRRASAKKHLDILVVIRLNKASNVALHTGEPSLHPALQISPQCPNRGAAEYKKMFFFYSQDGSRVAQVAHRLWGLHSKPKGHSPEQPAPADPVLHWAGQDHLQRSPPPNYSVFCHLLGYKAPSIALSKQEHSSTDLCSARTPEKHGPSQATVCAGHSTEKTASKFTETYNPLLVREWKHKQLGPVKGFTHKQKEEKHL